MPATDWRSRLHWSRRLWKRYIAGAQRSPASACESSGEQLLQQQSRLRTADGFVVIRGTVLAEFAQGQRETTIYLGFCPPFDRLPEIAVRAEDDCAAVKITQRLHQGAQLEVRLTEPAEEAIAVKIEFSAMELAARQVSRCPQFPRRV